MKNILTRFNNALKSAAGAATATQIKNALKTSGLSDAEFSAVYNTIIKNALKHGTPMTDLVLLYSRTALAQKELGITKPQMLTFTDNVAAALRFSGPDTEISSGALLHLANALRGGMVRSEEFNALLEGAYGIVLAAAVGLDEAAGDVGKLRLLVRHGKVSSQAFFRAFELGAYILHDRADVSGLTLEQCKTNIRTAMIAATPWDHA